MHLIEERRNQVAYRMAIKSDSHVLIAGETGTGKTSLAYQIHQQSPRRSFPFITINLATVHEGTLESELFGHERGAFTGADQKRVGKLQLAHGGTLFLDEIGELPLRLQARLLEFLQSKRICPVGSNREIQLDVRVIAATHRNLDDAVRAKSFREDLYHRICVIPLRLKSIREQEEDLDSIMNRVLEEVCRRLQQEVPKLSTEVRECFLEYSWPGNYRELSNVLEYAVLAHEEGEEITVLDLPGPFLEKKQAQKGGVGVIQGGTGLGCLEIPMTLDYRSALCTFEKEYFRRMLYRNSGKITRTAKQIGLPKSTLLRRIRAYELTLTN
jgi:transcriptional regulator with PAS, ATPase and Fis domain